MFDKVIFNPAPRTYVNRTIGVSDAEDKKIRFRLISIQIGSKSGKWIHNVSNSAILERREDGFYELLLHNLEQGPYEVYKVFRDTKDPKEVCRRVERMYETGALIAHKRGGRKKPILIPNNQ